LMNKPKILAKISINICDIQAPFNSRRGRRAVRNFVLDTIILCLLTRIRELRRLFRSVSRNGFEISEATLQSD
jgi:hypothetical protein